MKKAKNSFVEQRVTPWTVDPNNIRSLKKITRPASL